LQSVKATKERVSYKHILSKDEITRKYMKTIADTIVLRDLSEYVKRRVITKEEMKEIARRIDPYLYTIIWNTRIDTMYDTLDTIAKKLNIARRFIEKNWSRIDKDYVLLVHMMCSMRIGKKYIVTTVTKPLTVMYAKPRPLLKNIDTRRTRLTYTSPQLGRVENTMKIYDGMDYLYGVRTAWDKKELLPVLRIIGKLDSRMASNILWHLACSIKMNATDKTDLFIANLVASLSRLAYEDMDRYRSVIEEIKKLLDRANTYWGSPRLLLDVVKERNIEGDVMYVEGVKYDTLKLNDNEILALVTMAKGVIVRKGNRLECADNTMVIFLKILPASMGLNDTFVVKKIK